MIIRMLKTLKLSFKCSMSKPVDFPVDDDWHMWFTGHSSDASSSNNDFLCILHEVQEVANLHYMSYIAPMDLLVLDWAT